MNQVTTKQKLVEEIEEEADRVVKRLLSVSHDRGTMAELRCLLTPNLRHRGWCALSRIGGIGKHPYEIVAGLFALHPADSADFTNFGSSCRVLAKRRKTGGESGTSPLDARFRRLLDADRDELSDILPNIFHSLKSEGIPVNYRQLFCNLKLWNEITRRWWAQEYWNPKPQNESHAPVSE